MHFIDAAKLTDSQTQILFQDAHFFSQNSSRIGPTSQRPSNQSAQVFACLMFLEPSTRTALSFEMAAKKLGWHCCHFYDSQSSLMKGESLLHTVDTLSAMGYEHLIIRTSDEDVIKMLMEYIHKRRLPIHIINAGSGKRHHPSQALLDCFTLKQFYYNDFTQPWLSDVTIGIAGDLTHSRVAHSNVELLTTLKAKVHLYQPEIFGPIPQELAHMVDSKCIHYNFDDLLDACPSVMMLRNQKERYQAGAHQDFFHLSDYRQQYHRNFGLNEKRLKNFTQKWQRPAILHPGPYILGEEICEQVLTHPSCLIHKQVSNGVFCRMGILNQLQQTFKE